MIFFCSCCSGCVQTTSKLTQRFNMQRKKPRLDNENVKTQHEDSSDDEHEQPKPKITVAERLKKQKKDVSALISAYAESDEDEKRGYVRKDDINRKVYGTTNNDDEEEEEDIAAMKQRVKKK